MNFLKIKTDLYKHYTKSKNIFSPDFRNYLLSDPILLYYSDFSKNWGDYINPFLVEKISGKQTVSYKRIYNVRHKNKVFGVGSILHHPGLENAIIWGSGFIYPPKELRGIPAEVLALRGKGSAAIMEKFGVKHNGLFGDPALLFPTFYKPEKIKKFKYGIIPHYSELEFFRKSEKINSDKDVIIISPMVKENRIFEIIDKICECEVVISSSLHGLILSDAYQIPSLRFNFSNKLVGGDFKFNDYYSGIGIDSYDSLFINDIESINYKEITNKSSIKEVRFDSERLKGILKEYFDRKEVK